MKYRIIEQTKANVTFEYFVEAENRDEAMRLFRESPPEIATEYIGDVTRVLSTRAEPA